MTNDTLTCPECGDELGIGEDWILVKDWKLGTAVGPGESIRGDYAHEDCV